MYPTTNQHYGVFVKEQVDEITRTIKCEHDLYYINARDKGKLQYFFSIFKIPLKIYRGKFDLIHIHYGLSALFLLFYRPKAKVFLTLHGSDILLTKGNKLQVYITRMLLKRVDKALILNKQMEAIVKPLKIDYEILPCGVNIDFFKPIPVDGCKVNTKLIVFPGSPLVEIKNYGLFKKVIEHLKRNTEFVIEEAQVNNLSREGVRDLLNKADCLLMTSISEGSPQVIKEALSCGTPVVSVPVGDVQFMLDRIPHCYVSETRKVEELATLVLKALEGKGMEIRKAFIDKKIYDHRTVTDRIVRSYGFNLSEHASV